MFGRGGRECAGPSAGWAAWKVAGGRRDRAPVAERPGRGGVEGEQLEGSRPGGRAAIEGEQGGAAETQKPLAAPIGQGAAAPAGNVAAAESGATASAERVSTMGAAATAPAE